MGPEPEQLPWGEEGWGLGIHRRQTLCGLTSRERDLGGWEAAFQHRKHRQWAHPQEGSLPDEGFVPCSGPEMRTAARAELSEGPQEELDLAE